MLVTVECKEGSWRVIIIDRTGFPHKHAAHDRREALRIAHREAEAHDIPFKH